MVYYSEPGVFNAVDPWVLIGSSYVGLVANDPSTSTAQNNATVLLGIIALANAACDQKKGYGATILIPGHSVLPPPGGSGTDEGAIYYFAKPDDATVAIPIDCNWPLRFLGTGSVQLVMAPDNNGNFGDFFSVDTSGSGFGGNEGGMTFEDLEIIYPAFETQQTYTAIHVLPGSQSFRMIRVVLTNCPIGLNLGAGSLHIVKNTTDPGVRIATSANCAPNTWCSLENNSIALSSGAQFTSTNYSCALSSTEPYKLILMVNGQTTTGFTIRVYNAAGGTINPGTPLGIEYACTGN